MNLSPILVVADDPDEIELINDAAYDIGIKRPIHYFRHGDALLEFLTTTDTAPLVILCEINMPGDNGFEIQQKVAANPVARHKCVPFIYWSTATNESEIIRAYDLASHGFFLKPNTFQDLCETLKTILDYWQKSLHPKRVE